MRFKSAYLRIYKKNGLISHVCGKSIFEKRTHICETSTFVTKTAAYATIKWLHMRIARICEYETVAYA